MKIATLTALFVAAAVAAAAAVIPIPSIPNNDDTVIIRATTSNGAEVVQAFQENQYAEIHGEYITNIEIIPSPVCYIASGCAHLTDNDVLAEQPSSPKFRLLFQMAILHRQRHHLWHPLHSWTVPTERRPSQPKPCPLCRSALQPPWTIIPSHPRCSPIPPRHLLQHRQQQQSHRSSLQRNRKPKNQRHRYHQTRANRRLRGSYNTYPTYLSYRNRYLPLLYGIQR